MNESKKNNIISLLKNSSTVKVLKNILIVTI